MAYTPLSCTIITFNEGDRIGQTIESVLDVADEIIVVDSGSSDDTVKIAESLGAKVIHNDWPGYGPQKRFSEDLTKHDWIINLDADEVLTPKLIEEIKAWKEEEHHEYMGYIIYRLTVYPTKTKPRLWADYFDDVRVYNKNAMRYRDSLVHDTVVPDGQPVSAFKHSIWHYSYRSLEHIVEKLDGYTTLQAKEIKKPKWKILLRKPFEYWFLLFKNLFIKRHITGGLLGIKIAHLNAKGRAARLDKFLANIRDAD